MAIGDPEVLIKENSVFVRLASDGSTVNIEEKRSEIPWDVERARNRGERYPTYNSLNEAGVSLELTGKLPIGKVIEVKSGTNMRYYRVTEPSKSVKDGLERKIFTEGLYVEPVSDAGEIAQAVTENQIVTYKQLPLTEKTRKAVQSMWYSS